MRRRVHEEDEIGELNIVPYLDIVTNLVMFMLLSMAGLISLGVLDVASPKIADASTGQNTPPPSNEPQLNLTVGIARNGFYVMGAGGVIEGPQDGAQDAVDTSRPPTVPKKGAEYDYAGLTDQLAKVKEAFPKELKLILVAESDIPYDIVVQTMDASREKVTPSTAPHSPPDRKILFPVVMLSAMR